KCRVIVSGCNTSVEKSGGTTSQETYELNNSISSCSMQTAKAWRAHFCSKMPESDKMSESVRSPTTFSISKLSAMVSLSNHFGSETAASAIKRLSCCVTSVISD